MAITDRNAWRRVIENRNLIFNVINERFPWLLTQRHSEVMSRDDYWQVGMIGLFRAAKKYDPKRGFKFSTYAYRWIYQSISRAYKTSGFHSVRIPDSVYLKISKLQKEHGEAFQEWMTLHSKKHLRIAYSAMGERISLDSEIVPESRENAKETPLKDIYAEEPKAWLGQAIIDEESRQILAEAFALLSETEKKVLVIRYGLEGGEAASLIEAAKILKMKRKVCLMAEISAFRKIREFLNSNGLFKEIYETV